MKILDRIKSFFGGGEGSDRGPFHLFGEWGNPYQVDPLSTGWETNLSGNYDHARSVAIVYACAMLYCRAISQCIPIHYKETGGDGDERQKNSPVSKILRYPNDYETWTQFIFQIVAGLMFDGEALAYKTRGDRLDVTSLHRIPRRNWSIHVEPESKEIFYGINQTDLYNSPDALAPARDVLHFRMFCPRHPLIGESPLAAAAMAVGITVALSKSQYAFFSQMSRPSGIMSTDLTLNAEQMKQLRSAFAEQSKLWNQGGTPILSSGLKWQAVNVNQGDAQLIEQQKLSAIDVARVYGVPMALLSDQAGTEGGTEALISNWLSVGLGSVIENLERTLDRAFNFTDADHIQLDPAPLLRVDFAGRIEGYVKAVQGGVMTPNEARDREGLKKVEGGDDAYLQRQMTSMSMLGELTAAELLNKQQPTEPPEPPNEPEPDVDEEKAKAVVINLIHRKRVANG